MNKQVIIYLLIGQSSFFIFLGVCLLLNNTGLADNNSICWYSNVGITLIPYILGFLISGIFTILAAHALIPAENKEAIIKYSLYGMGFLILSILMTPYYIGKVLFNLHVFVSLVFFLFEFVYALGVTFFILKNRSDYFMLYVLTILGIFTWAANSGYITYRFLTQTTFQCIFCILLIRSCIYLYSQNKDTWSKHI